MSLAFRIPVALVLFLLFFVLTPTLGIVHGQGTAANASSELAATYIPSNAIASISVWPELLASRERFQLAPLEVITAAGMEKFGIDPLKIKRVDVAFGMPGIAGPEWGAVFQLSDPIQIQRLNEDLLDGNEFTREGDFSFLWLDVEPLRSLLIHQVNPNLVLVGTQGFVRQMVFKKDQKGPLAKVVSNVTPAQDVLAIFNLSEVRPMLDGLLAGNGLPLPPDVVEATSNLVKNTDYVYLAVTIDKSDKFKLVLSAPTEQAAQAMEPSIKKLLLTGRSLFLSNLATISDVDSLSAQANQRYMNRLSQYLVTALQPKRDRNQLALEIEGIQNIGTVATLTGLLLPAVQSARFAARRMQSSNNIKQLALALLNYESAFKSFPSAARMSNEGKPLLSWRVTVLPFMEGGDQLYKEFHLDEAWDSPHNIKLLERMPAVYKHPNRNLKPGYTVYQVPVGQGTLFRLDKPTRIREVTDGLSNTILIVETASEIAVPWTAPEDYDVDFQNPLKNLFEGREALATIGIADGSVTSISNAIDPKILKALFTHRGGEVVELP